MEGTGRGGHERAASSDRERDSMSSIELLELRGDPTTSASETWYSSYLLCIRLQRERNTVSFSSVYLVRIIRLTFISCNNLFLSFSLSLGRSLCVFHLRNYTYPIISTYLNDTPDYLRYYPSLYHNNEGSSPSDPDPAPHLRPSFSSSKRAYSIMYRGHLEGLLCRELEAR